MGSSLKHGGRASARVLRQATHDIIKIKVMLNLFQHPTRKAVMLSKAAICPMG
jgi:hypothetical protein